MSGSMKILGLHTICSRCLRILHRTQRLKSTWSSAEVRSTFLDYFCQKQDHLFVPSSSVIPKKGEGTYFTNAGMNQFKPIFLGSVDKNNPMASYRRVANSQKCVRVGGKHNDLEDVGKDLTHHTFFEMLGSWSFGDYFKKEACRMALELLTKEYKLSLDRLYFTYFAGCESASLLPDNETREIWLELGVPESRVLPFGMKDNFWDMGETGPCGPCTEIHYSHRGNSDCSHLVNADSPEVVEIWNLVFMQYNRDISQKLLPLPSQHVDTGMGLERIVGVLQNTMSNYDTDLFIPLFNEIHKNSKYGPYRGHVGKADKDNTDKAYRIIADHIRMATVCIADGLLPDKSKLGHKLRSIIYRCIEQSFILKMDKKRLSSLVDPVSAILGDAYPEIQENESKIKQILESCENSFWKRWGESQSSFRKFLRDRDSNKEFQVHEFLPLLDGAYGRKISTDMLESVARTFNVPLDSDQLHDLLAKRNAEVQPSPVRQSSNTISAALLQSLLSQNVPETEDVYKYSYTSKDGVYEFDSSFPSSLLKIIKDSTTTSKTVEGDNCCVVLDNTCFYAEGGGQASDQGVIRSKSGEFCVTDVQKHNQYVFHYGFVKEGHISEGDQVTMDIDQENRLGCMKNHTSTHLLNAALRRHVGNDVLQQGSNVLCDKMTFDFSSQMALDNNLLIKVEKDIQHAIQSSFPVTRQTLPFQQATSLEGVVMLHNETYPGDVNVITIHDEAGKPWSSELCGGTHVDRTSDIEHFTIIGVSGQNTKRVYCLTGQQANQAVEEGDKLSALCGNLEKDVKSRNAHHTWTERIKEIRQVLGTEDLPKLVREKVAEKSDIINSRITEMLSEMNKRNLRQKVIEKTSTEVVDQLLTIDFPEWKNPNIVPRALYDVKLQQPLAVFLGTKSNSCMAVICFPKNAKKIEETLLENVPRTLSITKTKMNNDSENTFYTVRGKLSKSELQLTLQNVMFAVP